MPTPSAIDRRRATLCAQTDDRFPVMFSLDAPWILSRGAGRWLRGLRAVYEEQLELLVFVRAGPAGASVDKAASHAAPFATVACGHTALLRRLRRLGLPSRLVVEFCQGPSAGASFAEYRTLRRWALLQAADRFGSSAEAAVPANGLVVPAHLCLPGRLGAVLSHDTIADFGSALDGFASQSRNIEMLAEAVAASRHGCFIGGAVIDRLEQIDSARETSNAHMTRVLDLLANAVESRRLAQATRRPRSLSGRL